MRRALEYVKPFGAVVAQHAQDPRLADQHACAHEGEVSGRLGLPGWPAVAEESIIARDVMLAAHTGSRLHVCHVSTAGSVEVIRWAKQRGIDVTAEVTPHHLLLTCDLLERLRPGLQGQSAAAPDEDVEALRAGLADGTIDAVATDHAPHASHDKDHAFGEAAFGMLGLETALGVVAADDGRDRSARLGRRGRPACRCGRRGSAGSPSQGRPIAKGEPANLTLVDPSAVVDGRSGAARRRCRATRPSPGARCPARVVATFYEGRPTVLDGRLAGVTV